MTRGITGKEPDPKTVYADIIGHPHWQSPTRPRMSLYDRAAQFAPYAALTGYHDMVKEEARQVDARAELGETDLERLNRNLILLDDAVRDGENPMVSVTYFMQDRKKAGGRYETVSGYVKKIDAAGGKIVLTRTEGSRNQHMEIYMKDILDLRGGFPEDPEDSREPAEESP